LLRFVVERHLDGRDDALKESVIALEVFGNRDYDPKQDSIVRTEVARLRARLAEYYLREGAHNQVRSARIVRGVGGRRAGLVSCPY